MTSVFRDALQFFMTLGVFDVILPFLLVFSIVFAIFEKTKVFGTEKDPEGREYAKKNINSMVAFVIAFFVIASSQLVQAITKISANMVILLMATTLFLLLAGSFHKEDEKGFYLQGIWKTIFMFLTAAGLIVIFLDAIMKDDNTTWLAYILDQVSNISNSTSVASLVLIGFVLLIMFYITGGIGGGTNNEHKEH